MRIIFTGGGTAGHINPALSVAAFVRNMEPDANILYVGATGGMEQELVPKAGFEFRGVKISGFSREISLRGLGKNMATLKRIVTASIESDKILKSFKPDICMGTGGYVSGPILKRAHRMGIPFIIHEQNAYPGVTTKLLSGRANKVMLACSGAQRYLDNKCSIVVTGNPIRKEIMSWGKEEAKRALKLDKRPVVLSFGGSLGARRINEAAAELMAWSAGKGLYNHIHAYGRYGGWFVDSLKDKGIDPRNTKGLYIEEYINDMPVRMAAADLVICRAGAITISELQAMGKPSILIPSPNVAENHQYHNAMELVRLGAASIIEEKDLTGSILIEKVRNLLDNSDRLASYSKNLRGTAIINADERIYSIIKQVMRSHIKQ